MEIIIGFRSRWNSKVCLTMNWCLWYISLARLWKYFQKSSGALGSGVFFFSICQHWCLPGSANSSSQSQLQLMEVSFLKYC